METKTIKGLTYEQLRAVFGICQDRHRSVDFKRVVNSIDEDLLEYDEFVSWDCFKHEDKWYSTERYCLDINNDLQDKDDCVYLDSRDEYAHIDNCMLVWVNRRSQEWFLESDDDNIYRYDGENYHIDALGDHELVMMEGGDIEHADNVYYWECDGEYHYDPEPEDESESYVRDYHNGGYRTMEFNDVETKYRIGFEIEKEDGGVKESVSIGEFEDKTGYLWRKERDGSLDDEDGYELVSPTFDFSIDHIFEHINNNPILVKHINACHSTSCGGHINLSKKGYSGREMFSEVKGYTPLMYALYHGRVNKNYSKGKSNSDLINENEKYQAIKIHDNRIEFRIISAVPSVDVLRWRCELIEMMLKYPCDDVRDAYYYFDTKFSKIIKKVYKDENKYKLLKDRLRKYTLEFEKIELKEKEDTPTKRKREMAKLLKQTIKGKKYIEGGEIKEGDKVVCLRNTASPEEWGGIGEVPIPFNVGDILTISFIAPQPNYSGNTAIQFEEGNSFSYPSTLFAPLQLSSQS